MKNIFRIFLIIFISSSLKGESVIIKNLRCEYKINPIGVDIDQPRFSWVLESAKRGVKQTAYQIFVSKDLQNLNSENNIEIWNSEKINSDNTIQIYYEGKTLESNTKYFWKVKVWDQDENIITSESAFWETGLFKETDWKAKWIGLDRAVGTDNPETPNRILSARMLRHEFSTNKKVKNAKVFISGMGLFELSINGKKIGDDVLVPGLTEYNKTTFYMTYDVTKNINKENAIGIILGNGRFFAPRKEIPVNTRNYGFPKVICQLEIKYEDGTKDYIYTDKNWKLTMDGPIRKNNEYDGEYYDATMEMADWDKINFNDSKWMNAELVEKPGEKLISQPNEPIKIMQELKPISVNEIKPGVFIFDMGQNMVGWVELFVKGNRGDKVTMRFAETLNPDGSLFLDNIRSAEVTDTYIFKGDGNEGWEPKFTYHGFRFVEMIGYTGTPNLNSLKGKVVHDALEITGTFNCSNELINQIYKNAYWGIRGNYRSMPTDCPQRDERHGWLGDRSSESTGESFIFNISNLYNKWACDMRDAQNEKGSIPDVAPSYWPFYNDNTTWAGTYLFVSDMLYNQYGDLKTIKTHYPNMQKWINHMSQYLKDGIMYKDTYGDWCVPPEDVKLIHTSDPLRTTSSEFIGTVFFNFELRIMAKFAKLLGKDGDAQKYLQKADEIKTAFNNKFLDKELIQYSNNSHTSNILAIAFDLVPSEFRDKIIQNLIQKILGESDGHVGNGIIGGQWLMRTLTNNGHADVAYLLASQSTYPSWGYMIKQGATTIWELWNGDHGDPGMNSGNHVMLLGDLIIWYYENLAGIKTDPLNPAFKHIIMKPEVLGDLNFVNANYNSAHGEIKSNWILEGNKFKWDVKIPANTTATIYIPTLNKENVYEGNQIANSVKGIKFIGWEDNLAIFEICSGEYSFTTKGVKKKVTKSFTSNAVISPRDSTALFGKKIIASISCRDKNAIVHYTIDGSEPNLNSPVYTKPFEITKNTIVKAQAYMYGFNPSVLSKVVYNFVDPKKNGIEWKLFEGEFKKLPDFNELKPTKQGNIYQFGLANISIPKYNFAIQYSSYIRIDKDGEYEFFTSSNDGSNLYINDKLVVDNDGEHALKQGSGTICLTKGFHKIRVEYFQTGGSKGLQAMISSKEISYQPIPAGVLFIEKE